MENKDIEFIKKNIFIGKQLRIFISYSDKDKKIASAIKKGFNYYGVEAFLAHDDIMIGQEWRDTILRNLKQFDIFVSILSKNFMESNWTDQEVGFAISRGTTIIPISIDGTLPYGFLEMFQTLFKFECKEYDKPYSNEKILNCNESIFEIIKIITNKIDLRENLKDSLIKDMTNIENYRNAEKYLTLLISLEPFNKEQINEIIKQGIENNQIYSATKCKIILKELIEKHDSQIESDLKEKIKEKISD